MDISGGVFRNVPCFYPAAAASKSNSMDVSGLVDRRISCSFGSEIFDLGGRRNRGVWFKSRRIGWLRDSGFSDEEHLRYYYDVPRCGVKKDREKIRRNLRLLEGFSKDSSEIPQIGFGLESIDDLVARFPTKPFTEVDEILEKLSKMRAEVKELKRKGKQEKAKEKASSMQNILDYDSSLSSSSSNSSDSDCEEAIDLSCHRTEAPKLQTLGILTQVRNAAQDQDQDCCSETIERVGNGSSIQDEGRYTANRIEVCMGKSCTKSGAAPLLEEFKRVVGIEGAVSECKCMGKCKIGPNVKVSDSINGVASARNLANPSHSRVGLEDVNAIVANTFGKDNLDYGRLGAGWS